MSVLENFKSSLLAKFDGRTDQYKFVSSINTLMDIIGAPDFLMCKLLSNTFRDATHRWYSSLFQALCYQLSRPSEKNSRSIHCKQTLETYYHQYVQLTSGSIRVVKGVSRPIQQIDLQGDPSESRNVRRRISELAQGMSFQRIPLPKTNSDIGLGSERAKCYIKGKEGNVGAYNTRRNQNTSSMRDRVTFKWSGKSNESFTPLNTHWEHIRQEVLHIQNILQLMAPKIKVMEPGPHSWCKYHKIKGHQMEDCYQLK